MVPWYMCKCLGTLEGRYVGLLQAFRPSTRVTLFFDETRMIWVRYMDDICMCFHIDFWTNRSRQRIISSINSHLTAICASFRVSTRVYLGIVENENHEDE